MMEGVPKQNEGNENFENPERWRELKEGGKERAEKLISEIEDFDEKTADEKVAELNTLIEELSEDNNNRYVARELSLMREQIVETERHEERMSRLGAVV